MSLSGYYDVTTFGASPTAPTNQASYIQAAIDACEGASVPGGVVYFPPGTYCVDASSNPALTITGNGVELRGAGAGASFIKDISSTHNAYPDSIISANNANSIKIRGLGFLGNNQPQSGVPTSFSNSIINITNASNHKVEDCYFTQNRAYTIHMAGVTDASITGTRFYDVGYNNGTNSGSNYSAEAIYYGFGSVGVRANHNSLGCCHYGGISLDCGQSDASHNRMKLVTAANIYPKQGKQEIRVGVNGCLQGNVFPGSGGTPIYTDVGVNAISIVGNIVSEAQADGLSVAAIADGVLLANLAIDSNQLGSTSGDSGLQINPHFDTLSQGVTVVGNNINQGGTPQGAIRVLQGNAPIATNPYVYSSTLMGNVVYGSVDDEIKYDPGTVGGTNYYCLQDDSNTTLGNGFWLERGHTNTPSSATTESYTTMVAVTVTVNGMLERGGVRLLAAGSFTGGLSARHFNVGFGPSPTYATNLLNGQAFTPASLSDTWQLVLIIMNNNEAGAPRAQQDVFVQFYGGGSLLTSKSVPLTIDTGVANQPNFIYIQGKNGASGNSVSTDFVAAERC